MHCKRLIFIFFVCVIGVTSSQANENRPLAKKGQYKGTKQAGQRLEYKKERKLVGRYLSPEFRRDRREQKLTRESLDNELKESLDKRPHRRHSTSAGERARIKKKKTFHFD